uniref:Cytochrome P450 n=1 Tax=Panagrolaimus superbus TaxID=310955 RepID=A0A914Z715_9BILA
MGAAVFIVFTTCIAVIYYAIYKHLQHRRQFDGIPSPRSYPFVGHMLITKPDSSGFIDQVMGMASLYPNKPRIVAFWTFIMPIVMIYSPESLEPIFTNPKHLNKPFLYDLLKPWLGLGLLTKSAETWRPRRKLLTPTFHYDILKNFVYVFNKQADIMVQQIRKQLETSDEAIEIGNYVTLCALDIICETSMGKCVNAQFESESEYVVAVHRINDIIQRRQKEPWVWNDILFNLIGDGKEHKWALNVLHSFTQKVIKERREEFLKDSMVTSERLAFLDQLLLLEQKGEITVEEIQYEVDTFMFEGHDTTSAGITWACHLLGNHPEVQRKVVEELDAVIGDSHEISYEHLSQLKYCECVIKESLRLYPSVPIFARVLGDDQEVSGHIIPKGTQILVNPYLIHRDPSHWDNAEEFRPERFLPENCVGRNAFAFVPFSAGSRNCIGQRFALMEEKTLLASILRNFQIESVKRRDQQEFTSELILRPVGGVQLKMYPRPSKLVL